MTEPAVRAGMLRKRSVTIAGHRTSVALEPPFWDALAEIAAARGLSLTALIVEVDAGRDGSLSSALRVYVLEHLKTERGGNLRDKDAHPSTGRLYT